MKNFNKMTRGEKAYAMNEVISGLNVETAYYSDWLEIWPDGASLKEAKEAFDYDVQDSEEDKAFKDELLNSLSRKFRIRVEMYGCKDGYSIQTDDVEGLRIPCNKNAEYEEEERGGGFYFYFGDEKEESEKEKTVASVRNTLMSLDYPLTEVNKARGGGFVFYIDHEEWRARKAAAFIKESIEWLRQEDCGCCTSRLTKNTQLAVGWENGFDPEDKTVIHSKTQPEWGIVVGIKAIEGDDLKTDFEWLTTPHAVDGENAGEVFTNLETSISPEDDAEKIFKYLFEQYKELNKEYRIYSDGRCSHR